MSRNRQLSRRALAALLGFASAGILAASLHNHLARPAQADTGVVYIGAPLPLTGPLAPFGATLRAGYQRAVDDANAAGGLTAGKERKRFELLVRDSQSQPTLAAQEARTLADENGVSALLGSVSPPLNIPVSTVADSKHLPMVMTLTPLGAWAASNPQGWKYAYDLFFAETQMTDLQYQAASLVHTNKRVALFTDNEQDGAVMGALWTSKAQKFGYTIAYHATFPLGTTDFGPFIAEAKKSGATVLIAQMIPPDAFALWKQMKSLAYAPAVAFCEKCGLVGGWQKELGEIGNGTMAVSWWSPSLDRPKTKEFVDAFSSTFGTADLSSVVASYSAAEVLLDAMRSAGSADAEQVNAALQKTDKNFPISRVRFNDKHQSTVPAVMLQWQGDTMRLVYPHGKASTNVTPLGLSR